MKNDDHFVNRLLRHHHNFDLSNDLSRNETVSLLFVAFYDGQGWMETFCSDKLDQKGTVQVVVLVVMREMCFGKKDRNWKEKERVDWMGSPKSIHVEHIS